MKRLLPKGSLRRKLSIVALVTIIAAQLSAAAVLLGWERTQARRSLADDLHMLSRIVGDNTAAALSFEDYKTAIETLESLGIHEGFEHACLYDRNGRLFAAHVASGLCRETPYSDGTTFADGLALTTPVMDPEGGRVGTLTLKSSLQPVNARLRGQIIGTVIVLLVSSLGALALTSRLQRQLTEPLDRLAKTAQAVSRDRDYSHRVPKEGDDEVSAVSDAFNDMLSQIQKRDEELQSALRLKDEFLATVSHELRTPLNAMIGWAHVLRSPQLSDAMMTQAAEAIDRNARMQARLIEDILDVSRIITGKLRLEPQPTDLVAIIRTALEVVQPSVKTKKITIEPTLPATAPFIGDPDRLRQVIWNLLSNAVKFTPQGGTVCVRLSELPGEYRIQVTDTGRGISPEFLPYIFQPFRQADGSATRSQGGLGLGLAIAKHLTELSGGSIHAESGGADTGATFSIRLPREPHLMLRPVLSEERSSMRTKWSDLEGHSVLVVDDNEDTRNVLTTLLEAHGAAVSTAASVAEARMALSERLPDVLITDLAMPVEDGFGLLEHCRYHTDRRLQSLPILALTAYGGQQAHDRVIAAGFDAYLAKPVEPAEVGRVVRELCTRKAAQKD